MTGGETLNLICVIEEEKTNERRDHEFHDAV